MSKKTGSLDSLPLPLAGFAIGVVWSFFAVMSFLMAKSPEFSDGARIGLNVAAGVCSLLAVLSVGKWIYDLIGLFLGDSTDDRGATRSLDSTVSEQHESRRLERTSLEWSDDSGELPLEIRDNDGDAEQTQGAATTPRKRVEQEGVFGRVFLAVMKVVEFIPTAKFLAIGLPGLLLFAWMSAMSVAIWTGLADRMRFDEWMNTEMDFFRQVAPVVMLVLIGAFFWRDRAYLDEPDGDKLYHASMLLCLSQLKAFAVLIVLGGLGIVVYVIGLVMGFWEP